MVKCSRCLGCGFLGKAMQGLGVAKNTLVSSLCVRVLAQWGVLHL